MKKLLSLVLVLALALSLSVTAFAADTTIEPDTNGEPNPSTADTSVEFNVASTYTITIPAKVELEKKTDTGTGAVTYEQDEIITASAGVRLLNGQSIQVTLSAGTDGFVLTSGESATLDYTVTVNSTKIENNGVIATFETSQTAQTSTLHFAADDPTYAGQYSDTVTFTIAIVTPASTGNGDSTEP